MPFTPPVANRQHVSVFRPSAARLGERLLQLLQQVATRPLTPLWVYLPLSAVAEVLIVRFGSELGLLLQALLIAALSYRASLEGPGARRNLILAISLVPFGRLLLLAQFLVPISPLAWDLVVALVLAGTASLLVWQIRLPFEELGWGAIVGTPAAGVFRMPRIQLLLGAGGFGLGLLEANFIHAEPLPVGSSFGTYILSALALILLTGFVGEVIFRGLVLNSALSVMKGWGLVYATLLFVALRAGHRPITDLAFAAAAGLLFAYVARSTHSLLAVSVANGVANVVAQVIGPMLAASSPGLLPSVAGGLLWLGALTGALAFLALAWFGTVRPAIRSNSLPQIRNRASREELNRIQRDLVRRGQTLATPVDPNDDWRAPSDGVSGEVTEWSRSLRSAVVQASKRGVATRQSIRAVVETTAQPIQSILQSLQETFAAIPDPRSPRGRRQPLPLILALATYAMLYGAGSVYSVTRWLRGQHPDVLEKAGAGTKTAPAPTTLHRIFNRIDAPAFENALRAWAKDNLPTGEDALIVDDKILRGVHGTPLPGVRLADGYDPAAFLDPLDAGPRPQPTSPPPKRSPDV